MNRTVWVTEGLGIGLEKRGNPGSRQREARQTERSGGAGGHREKGRQTFMSRGQRGRNRQTHPERQERDGDRQTDRQPDSQTARGREVRDPTAKWTLEMQQSGM